MYTILLGNGLDEKYIIPIMVDNEIYNLCSQLTYGNRVEKLSIDDVIPTALELFDESFLGKTQNWQLLTIPYYTDEKEILGDLIKTIFPGLFAGSFPYDTTLYYEGINTGVSLKSTSTSYVTLKSELDNEISFPLIYSRRYIYSNGLREMLVLIPVIKEDNILDGKFNFNIGDKIYAITLYFGKQSNGFYVGYRMGGSGTTVTVTQKIASIWNGKSPQGISDDPFNPGGDSGTGGGGGDFDNTSTPIDIPSLPTVSAASTGFISLFNPTLSQLNELASYLWSDLFEIDGWKKLFADPMDAILGLSILPVPIPTSGPKEVKVGNIGTGISLNVASTQFVEVECGSINVNEYWGAYLDYSPYTQCQIYLPYVGTRPISVDEIMGKTVNVKYHVDILTGACCCFIKCGDSVLYTFNGQCSIPIPINSANYTSVINGIISVAASVGSMIATGGASAPLAIPHLASTVANQMKPNIEKSGAISGSGAVLNIQTPYLILTRPRQALPKDQNTFTGYPSFVTVTLGELSGYTEVYNIHLENIPATADEISEIETLLKGGVIF